MANEKRWQVKLANGKSVTVWESVLSTHDIQESTFERVQTMNVGEIYEDIGGNTWERKQ
ncbi:hypothetical protein [Xanthomonas phage Suba]|uniref:Phage protein n=1 Tax=Xanthomonas phage Suba TaxID=2674975 RepID=A0A679K1S2_9CAUD|nr:hypothetical protein QAY88_gp42 [Xanthomonas phage Suba]CAA2409850.1 hypothetical protein [Xanthomonas phage Suba]